MLLHDPASKTNTSWLEPILHPFGVGTSHKRPWTHLTHHGPDSGEATTFPHIVLTHHSLDSGEATTFPHIVSTHHDLDSGEATTFPHIVLTHHDLDSGEATTFPHIVFSAFLRGSHIWMALFPGTPKEESRNCPGLDSRDFGHSYLLAPSSDWSEV